MGEILDKATACEQMKEAIMNATNMVKYERDEEGKGVPVQIDLVEGIKEEAIGYVEGLKNYVDNSIMIYHGKDDIAEFMSIIQYNAVGQIEIIIDVNMDQVHRGYYKTPEEILYASSIIHAMKDNTEEIKEEPKVM